MTYCIWCEKPWPELASLEHIVWPCNVPVGTCGMAYHTVGPFCPNETCSFAFEAGTKIVGVCSTVLLAA